MPDKDEALAEYTFHIALENSRHKDYWTEKLADPILRGCFPIYSGCTNVFDYFPEKSMVLIDTGKPDKSIETIRQILQSHLDQENHDALAQAKYSVLHKYNIFAVLEEFFATELPVVNVNSASSEAQRLYSDHEVKNKKISRRIGRYFKSLFSGPSSR